MNKDFRIHFCVPPNYDHLMSELYIGTEHFGEINTEKGYLEVILYGRKSGEPWELAAEDILELLQSAIDQLKHRSIFFSR